MIDKKMLIDNDTPAAQWREDGLTDPFDDRYSCLRKDLSCGHMTDDNLAHDLMMNFRDINGIVYVIAAQDRIRWLSRQVEALKKERDELLSKIHAPGIDVSKKYDTSFLTAESDINVKLNELISQHFRREIIESGLIPDIYQDDLTKDDPEAPMPDNCLTTILTRTGDVFHNLGCNESDESLGDEYSNYATTLWNIANAIRPIEFPQSSALEMTLDDNGVKNTSSILDAFLDIIKVSKVNGTSIKLDATIPETDDSLVIHYMYRNGEWSEDIISKAHEEDSSQTSPDGLTNLTSSTNCVDEYSVYGGDILKNSPL